MPEVDPGLRPVAAVRPKALLLFYSFTGQAQRAVEAARLACEAAGMDTCVCRVDFADPAIRLQRPMAIADVKRWTQVASAGRCEPICVTPEQALGDRYDYVGVFSNTWQNHPSTPIWSLLHDPRIAQLIAGTPFAVYVVCRRLWQRNAEKVTAKLVSLDGICVGARHFPHRGGPFSSLLRTVSYLLSSGGPAASIWGVKLPLPRYGLAPETLACVGDYTHVMCAAAQASRLVHVKVS
jgi:hypothetical protein